MVCGLAVVTFVNWKSTLWTPLRVIFVKARISKTNRVPSNFLNVADHTVNLPESRTLYLGADSTLTAVALNK